MFTTYKKILYITRTNIEGIVVSLGHKSEVME